MSTLIFYEKPGCATNSRQKLLLKNAGVEFETRSLLAEKWTTEKLRPFFQGLPVEQWFNRAAPRVKKGEVRPERVTAEQALELMVADPLLIRRPLLTSGHWFSVGFDWDALAQQLNLETETQKKALSEVSGALEGCSHGEHSVQRCAAPKTFAAETA